MRNENIRFILWRQTQALANSIKIDYGGKEGRGFIYQNIEYQSIQFIIDQIYYITN